MSFNHYTNEVEAKEVVSVFENEVKELTHVTINGVTTTATPEHPFYVIGQGYIPARNLRAGDIVVTVNGDRVTVEAIQHEILENPITVYNFEVMIRYEIKMLCDGSYDALLW